MPEKPCPSRRTLQAASSGKLSRKAVAAIKVHLRTCAACRAVLAQIKAAAEAIVPDGQEPRLPDVSADDHPVVEQAAMRELGEYQLMEKLGEGGMGAVYRALHTGLDRLVAVKVLPAARMGDEQAVARFRREMKAVGRLDHPNIVRAHDARQIDGTHVLVMEYVDGLDLAEVISRQGPLGVADACEITRQAALGLHYAHQHGLVHRDVKPSNLMLTGGGRVKVLDLGLARFHGPAPPGDEATSAGLVMGTPDYMAPEQTSDSHSADARADVYSLGCTLYKMLSGQAPFSGSSYGSAFDKMAGHVRDPVPPISRFRDDLPEAVKATLERMLEKDPDDRFPTAGDVADAMAPHIDGCHLPALAARAQGKPVPQAARVTSTGNARHLSTDAAAGGRRAVETETPRLGRRWLLAGVAAAVVVVLMVVVFLMTRSADPVADGETGQVSDSGNTGESAPTVPSPFDVADHEGEWLVFSWTVPRRGKPDLWLFSLDGKRRLPLTRDADSYDIHPQFSPDGRRIAFARASEAERPDGVWVCDTDGGNLRQLVAAQGASQRVASPVWISDGLLYYANYPGDGSMLEMEIWQVDAEGENRCRVFSCMDAVGVNTGLLTDVSPDGRRLAIIAQRGPLWPTANVYVTDLTGRQTQTIWSDTPDNLKDARALWSPLGDRIAWHHVFTPGRSLLRRSPDPLYSGVGQARLANGEWSPALQEEAQQFVTPLAWSPDGKLLLCAELHGDSPALPGATLFLMNERFERVDDLFELDACCWLPEQRDYGRLADWAKLPDDAPLPAAAGR